MDNNNNNKAPSWDALGPVIFTIMAFLIMWLLSKFLG